MMKPRGGFRQLRHRAGIVSAGIGFLALLAPGSAVGQILPAPDDAQPVVAAAVELVDTAESAAEPVADVAESVAETVLATAPVAEPLAEAALDLGAGVAESIESVTAPEAALPLPIPPKPVKALVRPERTASADRKPSAGRTQAATRSAQVEPPAIVQTRAPAEAAAAPRRAPRVSSPRIPRESRERLLIRPFAAREASGPQRGAVSAPRVLGLSDRPVENYLVALQGASSQGFSTPSSRSAGTTALYAVLVFSLTLAFLLVGLSAVPPSLLRLGGMRLMPVESRQLLAHTGVATILVAGFGLAFLV